MAGTQGITLNAKNISYLVAILGLVGILYGGVSTITGYAYRIETLELRESEVAKQIEGLNSHIVDLNKQISALTIAITKLEVLSSLQNKDRATAPTSNSGGV